MKSNKELQDALTKANAILENAGLNKPETLMDKIKARKAVCETALRELINKCELETGRPMLYPSKEMRTHKTDWVTNTIG